MIFSIYSVRDELTSKFMNPMFVEDSDQADQVATRQFKSQINNIQLWKDNCSDYSLYKVGLFDDELGVIGTNVEKVCSGRSVLE